MYRIALCENEEDDMRRICDALNTYITTRSDIEMHFDIYTSSDDLIGAIEEKKIHYDTFVLDIIMPDHNGIQLGQIIRETDSHAPIIYTTSSKEFALEAYGVEAVRYLSKPIEYGQLEEALDFAYALYVQSRPDKVHIKGKSGMCTVEISSIMYIENAARAANYYLEDGSVITSVCSRGSFEAAVGSLSEHPDFIHPHKSYFVNMHFIRTLGTEELMLDDLKVIPISRRNATSMKKRYLRFMAQVGR